MEPTSEQELKQLLDEGRITEEEHKELLEAIRQKETVQEPIEKPGKSIHNSADKPGKIALILVLSGIVFPLISYFLLEPETYKPNANSTFKGTYSEFLVFIFLGMQLVGFVMGIISWKSRFGKAATIIAGILLFVALTNFVSYPCIQPQ